VSQTRCHEPLRLLLLLLLLKLLGKLRLLLLVRRCRLLQLALLLGPHLRLLLVLPGLLLWLLRHCCWEWWGHLCRCKTPATNLCRQISSADTAGG
jgi:hypothetical protein